MKSHFLSLTLFQLLIFFIPCFGSSSIQGRGTMTDPRDGHVYQIVTVGNQVWMAENLAYLPSVSPPGNGSDTTALCYVYGYSGTDVAAARSTSNYAKYGVLYNFAAAKKACPKGWHLPSDQEWKQLELALGMPASRVNQTFWRGMMNGTDPFGRMIKSKSGWKDNGNGDNDTGLSCLPAGVRYERDGFGEIGEVASWWSSTYYDSEFFAWVRNLRSEDNLIMRSYCNIQVGISVRCVKD